MIIAGNKVGPQILRFDRNLHGRDFAVGDIHGCVSALQTALDTIGFSPAMDRLFCAGDLVDRGPGSHLVVEWLDKPWFFSTLGNHETMVCEYALAEPDSPPSRLHLDHARLLDLPKNERPCIGHRLRALPLTIEVETSGGPVGLVHADFPGDDWHAIDAPLTEDEVERCLWSTRRFARSPPEKVRNVRALIHGHLTLPVARQLGNVFYIDTGGWMVGEGHFTFVDLASLELIRGPGPNASAESRSNR